MPVAEALPLLLVGDALGKFQAHVLQLHQVVDPRRPSSAAPHRSHSSARLLPCSKCAYPHLGQRFIVAVTRSGSPRSRRSRNSRLT